VRSKLASRLLALGVGGLLILPPTAAPWASPPTAPHSWREFRDQIIERHPHYLPVAPTPPAQGVTRAWVEALGQYFRAMKKAMARIRKAYLRTIRKNAPARRTAPVGGIRGAVLQSFGSQGGNALAVLQCENPQLNPSAIHHNADGTSDWGLFQINIVYNRGAFDYPQHLLEPAYNIAVALNVYRARGWRDWTCGRILGLA
jgi:hypothetical protein